MTSLHLAVLTVVVCFSVFSGPGSLSVSPEDSLELCAPTPQNMRELYINECSELLSRSTSDCTSIWNTFSQSFAFKHPSTVTAEDYRPYFDELPTGLTRNLNIALFWSRTSALVGMLSCMCAAGANIISSANAPSTAIVNNVEARLSITELRWCGTTDRTSLDGIEYNNWCSCSASSSFFEEFSVLFARASVGLIFYLGYGENVTFSDTSFFSRYELPNLDISVISATVMVVHRKGIGESCGEGSLIKLEKRLQEKGIDMLCYDVFGDPRNKAELPALTSCAMGIIDSIQNGREPDDSSGCFRKGGSGVTGGRLSLTLAVIAVLLAIGISYH